MVLDRAIDFNLNKQKMPMGVLLAPTDPNKLEGVRDRESDIVKERIQMMLKAGANVILTTKGIDQLCLKYCTYFVPFKTHCPNDENLR